MRFTTAICTQLVLLLIALNCGAQTFVGTIVFSRGDVKILRSPDGSVQKKHLIYEGKKYNYEDVRIGKKILPGEYIQTGTDGKAKITYANGDHFNIGPGTFISMPKPDSEKKSGGSSIDMFYGRLRSLISKDGPRNKLKVKTPATTAGVRGTDFFVRHNLSEGSDVTVLRGLVSLPAEKSKSQPVLIKKAQTARVTKANTQARVALAQKQDLLEIQKESAISIEARDLEQVSKETLKEINQLENAAKKVVMDDIKTDDPRLYKELSQKNEANVNSINTEVVAKLFQQAPGKINEKPSEADLEGSAEDVYKKYFEQKK